MDFKYSLSLLITPPPVSPNAHLSVSLDISNYQILRNFGWRYAIGRALRMFPHFLIGERCVVVGQSVS